MPDVTDEGLEVFASIDELGRMRVDGMMEDGVHVLNWQRDITLPFEPPPEVVGPTPVRIYRDATQHEKVRRSFKARTPASLDRGIAGAHVQEGWHLQVIRVLEKFGVHTIDHFNYVSYADGLKYKVCKYVWLMDRSLEHTILRQRWEARGLDPLVLDAIDKLQPWNVGKLP